MNKEILDFLGKEIPDSLSDIREVLELLSVSIDDSIEKIGQKLNESYSKKDFEEGIKLLSYSKEIDSISKRVQDIISQIDEAIDEEKIKIDDSDVQIQNESPFLVNSEVEHNLYEDLTYKKPCAIKIKGKKIEVKDWKGALVKTIKYLGEKDKSKIIGFIDDPNMNGKKVSYFAKQSDPSMRAPVYIYNLDIYVETNLSANAIRNLLIKILKKFNIKLSEYKIYLKADYSQLH